MGGPSCRWGYSLGQDFAPLLSVAASYPAPPNLHPLRALVLFALALSLYYLPSLFTLRLEFLGCGVLLWVLGVGLIGEEVFRLIEHEGRKSFLEYSWAQLSRVGRNGGLPYLDHVDDLRDAGLISEVSTV